ncbi:unnamed protein product [Caenorhabditis auriculariae]|uniref:J domain-containing protein n=1 Tax=Caenorhabditis auriculariae TaxID=2777116 RepID=A0A8S1HPU6_9PELO|nr:unnamed protein product [Caenorhabditis auriculariae]
MARASFEYDEVGNTFYYVLVSFYAIILFPATYYLFPTGKTEELKINEHECQCSGCEGKRKRKEANKPWRRTKKIISIVGLAVAWLIFAMIVKKITEIEPTHKDYDPYQILGLDQGADGAQVKKAYRDLSKVHHPDKGGDPLLFDRIAKAYQALTDKEARENWEKYGNPDGPTATTFGIALPKWLVSKEYGIWVLAFYGLIFMVIMPSVVGIWWYNSIKYNVDKVLMSTTRLYFHFIEKTPRMEINRMIYVLSGSMEFCKSENKEIVERASDETELPRLMKSLPNLADKSKERPLSMPYALKARILMHAYLSRIPLESEGGALDFDQRYVIIRTLRLIEEMISVAHTFIYYTQVRIPVDTVENLMRLQPMFVQALWPRNSPLMQLPHITDYNLTHLRKNRVFSCHDLAKMDNEKRRGVLRSLTDSEYRDVMVVLSSMPRLNIDARVVVECEDDAHEVTAGCVVTLKVTLKRSRLIDPQEAGLDDQHRSVSDEENEDEENSESDDDEKDENAEKEADNKVKRKPWEKQKPKKGAAKKKAGNKKQQKKKPVAVAPGKEETKPEAPESPSQTKKDKKDEKEKPKKDKDSDSEGEDDDEASSGGSDSEKDEKKAKDEDSDDDWDGGLGNSKKISFEAKTIETHSVHCPYYPAEKYEWWWVSLMVQDKRTKQRMMVSAAQLVKTLVDEHTIDLRFGAPKDKGIYHYQLAVKSDSYMDAEYTLDVKLDVKESKVLEVKHEDYLDDEEDKSEGTSEEEYTEGSDSDEE